MTAGLDLNQSLMLEPEFIARAVVNAGRGFTVVPGLKWKAIYHILSVLPETLVSRLPGLLIFAIMYTKQEMARLREAFWTTFGKYMAPVPSAEGQKINWINYKTGVKHIRFVMQLNDKDALTGILITHPEASVRASYFNRFTQLRSMFLNTVQGDWVWNPLAYDEFDKPVSIIYTELPGKTIKDQQNWPAIISFFKTHIIALDGFWVMVKDGFEV